MNINESGCRPYGMASALMVIGYQRDTPTAQWSDFFYVMEHKCKDSS